MKRSRLTLFVLLAAWLVSLGVVYMLGVFSAFSFHRAPDGDGLEGQPLEDRAYAVLAAQLLDEPVDWAALKSGDSREALPSQVREILQVLNREPDEARRSAAATTVAEAFPARRVVSAVEQLLAEPVGPGRDALLTALFHRWGRIDGRSALDFTLTVMSGNGLEDEAIQAALEGWAAVRPEMAWEWIQQHPASRDEEQVTRYAAVLAARPSLSESQVRTWLNEIPEPFTAERVAGREAVRRLVSRGPRAALGFAEAVTDDYASRTAVLADVLEAWTRQDREMALRWFATLDPDGRTWALPAIAKSWSERNGAEALRWLSEQPASAAQATAMREAAQVWLEKAGPAALGEFLNATEDLSGFSPAIEMLALDTMTLDPETAYSWASLIAEAPRRRYIRATVASYWLASEPEAAEAALRARGDDPALQALSAEVTPTRTVVASGDPETYELSPGERLEIRQDEEAEEPAFVEVGPGEAEDDEPIEEGDQ